MPGSHSADFELIHPPTDSVSSIAFSPQADYLAVASWDETENVRIYEVQQNGQSRGKAAHSHRGPALSVCWDSSGTRVFSGGTDNAARMLDATTGQSFQVAQHDAPVKAVKWAAGIHSGILATASWDRTLRYWDLRQSTPVATISLPERCYSMDILDSTLAVATARKEIHIYNLDNPTVLFKTINSSLRHQLRVVSCFKNGIAIGGVEGRVAIQYFAETTKQRNYTFRSQKEDSGSSVVMDAVNDISFHPKHGTFVTCGSDGKITSWDGESRVRIKAFDQQSNSVTASAFSRTGSMLAYAVCYDWHRGHVGMPLQHQTKIKLHACADEEVKRRPLRA